jgi:LysM repeat protein
LIAPKQNKDIPRTINTIKLIKNGRIYATSFNKRLTLISNIGTRKHIGLIFSLIFFVILANLSQETTHNSQFITTSADETVAVAMSVAPYMPLVNVNAQSLKLALNGQSDSVITKPAISQTINSSTHYTVLKGDTLTNIASSHGVTTGTILEANHIAVADMEKIPVGTVLEIPAESTTDSLDWLNQLNQQKADQAKAALLASRETASRNNTRSQTVTVSSSTGGVIVPIHTKGVSRGIGWDGGEYHTGIDYRADVGTPVVAAKTGRVKQLTSAWTGTAWGNSIVLDHGGSITTRYAHLSKISVHVGDYVTQGTIIGYSGNTGNSTGPHLHFEMNYNGAIMNPFTGQIMRK